MVQLIYTIILEYVLCGPIFCFYPCLLWRHLEYHGSPSYAESSFVSVKCPLNKIKILCWRTLPLEKSFQFICSNTHLNSRETVTLTDNFFTIFCLKAKLVSFYFTICLSKPIFTVYLSTTYRSKGTPTH